METQGPLRETLLRDQLASRPAGNDVLQIEGRLKSSLDAAMRIRVSTVTVSRKSRNNNVRAQQVEEQQCKGTTM